MNKKTKKKLLYIIIVLILIVCVSLGYVWYVRTSAEKATELTFKEAETIVEYGSKAEAKDLVEKATGTIITYPKINTESIGEQTITYLVQYRGVEKEITHTILVKDTQAPIIKLKQANISIEVMETYDPLDNIESVVDPVDGDLPFSKDSKDGSYTVEASGDSSTAGSYQVTICAYDKAQNKATATFLVTVEQPIQIGNGSSVGTGEGGNETNIGGVTYVNGILLVNKTHPVPQGYGGIDSTASAALQRLQAGANAAGYAMPLLSGYRSYAVQTGLYNSYVARDGQAAADRYSARPGTSEHQTGLAFDIGELDDAFGYTPAGSWLASHAHEYGFIIRYPEGKEDITGYQYEPWHVRYVGVEVAQKVFESRLTLEEYLGVYN